MIPSNSPIIGMRRKGTYDDPYVPITETFTVRDGRVILTEIPDQFTHVTVSGYTEVYKNIPTATQFYADYNLGIIYFNSTKNNTSLSFTYKGTGAVYFPASRIWTEVNGRDVTETLSDMITAGNNAIQSLNDVNAVIDSANTKITQTETARQNAITATTNANTATTQANTARDSANTAATSANTATTSANTAASNANAAKANADTATGSANTAASNANTATTNANNAVNNLLHLGTYSSATTYQPKNMVTYNNEIFMCLVQSTNVTPVDGVKWRRMLTVADVVTNAQTATTNANTATTNANNAATNATTQANYAKSKGDDASLVATNFNTAESGRATAEGNRVTAETSRTNAESTRVTQETARVNAEGDATKGRVKAESLRVTSESNRVTAENNRVSAETTRAGNETTRQTQESTRQSQESTRQSQETTRQTNTTNAVNAINATNNALHVWESYSYSKTYKPLNKVSYNGSSYVCLVECLGVLPTDINYFQLLASKGQDGLGSVDSVNSKTGAVVLTATDVGAETPTGAQTKANQAETNAKAYADTKVAALVDSSPATLDTLNELAAALGDDPNFATTISTQIGNKVDKVAGKQLSTEDYTTVEKTKLAGIQDGANNYTHPATHPATMVTGLSTVATSGSFNDLDDKPAPFDPGTLATVATTGSYTDLSNKPTLPSTLSQLTDDTTHRLVTDTEKSTWNFKQNALSGDVTDHYHTADRYTHPANHPASMVTGLATVATTGNYLDLSGKPTIPTKTSDLTNDSGFVEISDGEFTPTLEGYSTAGSNTYSTQRGYYTRIGNFVHCDIYLALSAKGAMSGSVIINNLPFTSANQTNRNYSGSISIAQGIDYDSGYTWLGASMAPNSNYISLIIMGDNINASAPQSTAFTASSLIELSIDYVV